MTDAPHLLENSKLNLMTLFDLAESIANGDLDREYGEFITNNPREGGPTICNGDQLLIALENCYLMKEFAYHLIQSGRLS